MADDIESVKTASEDIVSVVMPHNAAVAVVDYRDFPVDPYGESGDYPYHVVSAFTTNEEQAVGAIRALTLGSGGDWPESVYSGLLHTIDGSSLGGWTQGSPRFIIVIGDAPPHDPEPFTGYTLQSVIDAAGGDSSLWARPSRSREQVESDKVTIYSIVIGDDADAIESFRRVSDATGGKLFTVEVASEVPAAILEAIGEIVQPAGGIVSRHAPMIGGNAHVDGTVRQLLGEDLTIAGDVAIVGDLRVPGTPSLELLGNPTFGGVAEGSGGPEPTGYTISLRGPARLERLVIREPPVVLPTVTSPPTPSGTRDLVITRPELDLGDPTTLRDIALEGRAGRVSVPPGTYGRFAARGDTTFVLGIAGTTQPSLYNLQGLQVSRNSSVELVGPVVMNAANSVVIEGRVGMESEPSWLQLDVTAGEMSLTGAGIVHGIIRAPMSRVTVAGRANVMGAVTADLLVLGGNARIESHEP